MLLFYININNINIAINININGNDYILNVLFKYYTSIIYLILITL